jgi:ankyrin repeat protein
MKVMIKGVIVSLLVTVTLSLASASHGAQKETKTRLTPREIRLSAQKALAILAVTNKDWLKTGYCYSCHHDTLLIRTTAVARSRGLPVDERLAFESVKKANQYLGSFDEAVQGTYFVDPALVDGPKLATAKHAGFAPNLTLAAYARRLLRLQLPDGHWVSSDRRPPQSHSAWSATAYSLQAIQYYLPERLSREKQASFARAKRWLLTATPSSNEDRSQRLFALIALGATKGEIVGAAKDLIGEQRADGGWAQTATCESDSYATGQALVALTESGALPATDKVYRWGLRFLLDSQAPDGSWHVRSRLVTGLDISPPYQETGFPYGKDQIVSLFGTAWAAQALALALNPAKTLANSYDGASLSELAPPPEELWVETATFGAAAELKKLLDGGLDVNAITRGGTPLLLLAATEADKVKLLIERGVDVNARSKHKFNALMVAANHTGTIEVLRLLLDNGAKLGPDALSAAGKPETSVPTPVFLSTGTGEPEKTRLLIERGDDVRQSWTRGSNKYTALNNAVDLADPAIIRVLVEAGANVNEPDRRGLTPLVRAITSNSAAVTQTLIELGADVNQADERGNTPLHYAALSDYGETEVVRLLLAAGANRKVKNKDGLAPAEAARKFKYANLAELIGAGK